MMKTLSKLFLLLFLGVSYNAYSYDSGYDAGYEWAQENDILNPYACNTPSSSFNDGCLDGVEDNIYEQEEEDDREQEYDYEEHYRVR